MMCAMPRIAQHLAYWFLWAMATAAVIALVLATQAAGYRTPLAAYWGMGLWAALATGYVVGRWRLGLWATVGIGIAGWPTAGWLIDDGWAVLLWRAYCGLMGVGAAGLLAWRRYKALAEK